MKKEQRKVDLTQREDLSLAVINLISIEEHLAFTTMKTGNEDYLYILNEVRKMRVGLMRKLLKNTKGEIWCISKHLLSTTMRLMETSTKYMPQDMKTAHELMKQAFDAYSLFWFLQNDGEENADKKAVKSRKVEK